MSICHVLAQEQETEDTHAHSESHKWKGIDVNTVLGNDDYAPNPGQLNTFSPRINKYPFEKGKIIFLYNVGTGMFLVESGNWGMEGRLFHESFGRPLYLFSDGYILSDIKEKKILKILSLYLVVTSRQYFIHNKTGIIGTNIALP